MPRAVLVLALGLAVVLAAGVAFLLAAPRPPPVPEEPSRTSRPAAAPAPRRPEPAVAPLPPPPPPVDADDVRRREAWARAVSLLEAGDPLEALRLVAALREDAPGFLEDPTRATLVVRMEDEAILAVDRLAEDGLAREARRMASELAGLIADPGRLDVLRGRHELIDEAVVRDRLRAEAKLLAGARTPEERKALLQHLERFGGRATGGHRPDAILDRLRSAARTTAVAADPLPVPDPDETEKRRMEQLEKLRQRNAVDLLDHIAAGLAWLALHQGDDGRITEDAAAERCKELDHPTCVRSSQERYPVAATALAALALLDFRDQDAEGLFEPTLARAVAWLLAQQKEDGSFPAPRGYSHAIAVMALGQAAASSKREDLRDAVRRGLAWSVKFAGPDGGHRYGPRQAGDLSVTGWVTQAVEAAGTAGVDAPEALREGLGRFWPAVWLGDGRFAYTAGGPERASLAPVGMLMGQVLAPPPVTDELRGTWRTALLAQRGRPSLYTLYYGVRILLAIDGKLPDGWQKWLRELADQQEAKGPAAGMWKKGAQVSGGNVLDTAFALLTLEHSLYRR